MSSPSLPCLVTSHIWAQATKGNAEQHRKRRGEGDLAPTTGYGEAAYFNVMSSLESAKQILEFFDVEDKDGAIAKGLDAMNTQTALQRPTSLACRARRSRLRARSLGPR